MNSWPEPLFPFGFLLGQECKRIPDHFRRIDFPFDLYLHANCKYRLVRSDRKVLFLTGECVHPEHTELTGEELVTWLMTREQDLQQEIDKLIGRFALISFINGVMGVQADASGMRSVYFGSTDAGWAIGTHALLVSRALGNVTLSETAGFRKLGSPGVTTPYEGVHRLAPNCELIRTNETTEVRRFFPTEAIEERSTESAWEFALQRAKAAAQVFGERNQLLASLTAGHDSRATLCALRDVWCNTSFFTYDGGIESHRIDCVVAGQIADRLGLTHHVLEYSNTSDNEQLLRAVRQNTSGHHQHQLALAYHSDPRMRGKLHVRSNMLEITRSNMFGTAQRNGVFRDGLSEAVLMSEYYARSGGMEKSGLQERAFESYMQTTHANEALKYMSSWDLFFIEHRMGAWRSGIIEESDIAFDTVNLFNSREILVRFYGCNESERVSSNALKELISRELEELADLPVNPKIGPDRSQMLQS